MLNYLVECMTIAVQTAIGACLWLGVVTVIVSLIAIASFLLNRDTSRVDKLVDQIDDVDSFIKGMTQGEKRDG